MRPGARAAGPVLAALLVVLGGCASPTPAPVFERAPAAAPVEPAAAPKEAAPSKDFHVVRKGDTLYSIALDHGQDYRDVAAWNNLENPNVIRIGQPLRVTPPEPPKPLGPVAVVRPVAPPAAVEASPVAVAPGGGALLKREPKGGKVAYSEQALAAARGAPPPAATAPGADAAPAALAKADPRPATPPAEAAAAVVTGEDGLEWSWPLQGRLIAGFSETAAKGVDIAGRQGEPVQAAAGGRVVYAGEGLRGYGRLVIIKHDGAFLSAYAHNSQILVKEGQTVARGQKIAEVGKTDTDQHKLHFEIRRQGKPVDPLKYLPAR